MQNFRSMAAGSSGSGRIFAGDRRMWPHPNQALKCPRCDSLNTKFCYYNNYNLSQPRHFCKSCRRYWTKGGVLRNVPVGGGCRKTKRSKPKSLPDSQKDRKTTSPRHHAGSESSDLTAAAGEISATSASDLHHLGDFTLQNPKNLASSAMESLDPASDAGVFKAAGSFSGLTTATNSGASLGFGFSNFSPSFRVYNNNNNNNNNNNYNNNNDNNYNNNKISSLVGLEEPKMPELPAGYLAQTVAGEIPAPQERQVNGGVTALGWHGNGEPGLFDMASVDQGYYWGQTQWGETDQSLFLP